MTFLKFWSIGTNLRERTNKYALMPILISKSPRVDFSRVNVVALQVSLSKEVADQIGAHLDDLRTGKGLLHPICVI